MSSHPYCFSPSDEDRLSSRPVFYRLSIIDTLNSVTFWLATDWSGEVRWTASKKKAANRKTVQNHTKNTKETERKKDNRNGKNVAKNKQTKKLLKIEITK